MRGTNRKYIVYSPNAGHQFGAHLGPRRCRFGAPQPDRRSVAAPATWRILTQSFAPSFHSCCTDYRAPGRWSDVPRLSSNVNSNGHAVASTSRFTCHSSEVAIWARIRPRLTRGNWSHGGKLLWIAPLLALGYSRYMATAKKPPDTLVASLRHQQKWIDEMRASARMRARLMKKIPKPVEFPRILVEGTNPGPSQRLAPMAAVMGPRMDASKLEEPPLPPADTPRASLTPPNRNR